MFKNAPAYKKGKTRYVQGRTTVLSARNNTDHDFTACCRDLFDISGSNFAVYAQQRQMRVGGPLQAVRVFNFGRENITHVMQNGLRVALPMVDIDKVVLFPGTRASKIVPQTPADLVGLIRLASQTEIPLQGNIVVAQYHRIVAGNAQEIRLLCRSMHFHNDAIEQLERTPLVPTVTANGDGVSLDIVTITVFSSTELANDDNVLEIFTNVMVSTKDTNYAPAHILDKTAVVMHSGQEASGLLYERSTVSNCVFVYHDQPTTMRYTHDCGMVIEITQVQDLSRPEGFYKEWHTIDGSGKFVILKTFIERSKISNATGFFVRRVEALNYTPKKELKEIYESFLELQQQIVASFRAEIRETVKSIVTKMEDTRQTLEKGVRETSQEQQATVDKLKEEVDKLKREASKAEREKEDLRQENKELRSFKREIADVLKVVGSVVGLGAVILSQYKSKKK